MGPGRATKTVDHPYHLHPAAMGLGGIPDPPDPDPLQVRFVHDDSTLFGQANPEVGCQLRHRAERPFLQPRADDHTELQAAVRPNPVAALLEIDLHLLHFRLARQARQVPFRNRIAQVDRVNVGAAQPDVGRRAVDGEGGKGKHPQQHAPLEGHEQGAESHRQNPRQVALTVIPEGCQCIREIHKRSEKATGTRTVNGGARRNRRLRCGPPSSREPPLPCGPPGFPDSYSRGSLPSGMPPWRYSSRSFWRAIAFSVA